MKKKILISILSMFLFGSCAVFKTDKPKDAGLYANMHTNKGDILLLLEYEKTPLTVSNFVGLSEGKIKNKAKKIGEPYYDNIIFHRVIKNFMIQGGDPTGTGRDGPGYKFKDEFHKDLIHDKAGILSMANSGTGTNGSQFFITHKATSWLNNKHTVFGHVVKGMETVNTIEKGDTILNIKIIRVGKKARKFNAASVFERLTNSVK